jgi:hypothetical protein
MTAFIMGDATANARSTGCPARREKTNAPGFFTLQMIPNFLEDMGFLNGERCLEAPCR